MTAIQEKIKAEVVPLLSPYVRRIVLFGSMARGEDGSGSDIDLIVDLLPADKRPPLGLKWFTLESQLSERLGRPVDLVTQGALNPRLRPYIEADQVVLYEAG